MIVTTRKSGLVSQIKIFYGDFRRSKNCIACFTFYGCSGKMLFVHAVLDERMKSDNSNASLVKHALLIKPDKAGSLYNEVTWTDVVKEKLPKQLPNIPVSKPALSKNAKVICLLLIKRVMTWQQIILNLHLLLRVRTILQNFSYL